MSEILHANIFFFITALSIIVGTIFLCVLAYHAIHACISVRRILTRIEEGATEIKEDVDTVRAYFKEDALIPRLIKKLFGGGMERKTKKARSTKSDLSDDYDM